MVPIGDCDFLIYFKHDLCKYFSDLHYLCIPKRLSKNSQDLSKTKEINKTKNIYKKWERKRY